MDSASSRVSGNLSKVLVTVCPMSRHTPGVQGLRQPQGQAPRQTRRDPHDQGGGGGPEGREQLQPHGGHPAQLGREGAQPDTLVPDIAMMDNVESDKSQIHLVQVGNISAVNR